MRGSSSRWAGRQKTSASSCGRGDLQGPEIASVTFARAWLESLRRSLFAGRVGISLKPEVSSSRAGGGCLDDPDPLSYNLTHHALNIGGRRGTGVLGGLQHRAARLEPGWVGSIPTRSRQREAQFGRGILKPISTNPAAVTFVSSSRGSGKRARWADT